MRTRIKVCCIASPEEAALAVAAGADALGLVSAMPTGPGPIAENEIARIAATVPPPVEPFLLTALDEAGAIADQAQRLGVRTVQLVRHVDPHEHARLRAFAPTLRIVQVIHVEDESALRLIEPYAETTAAFLLDSGRPGAQELGGTGRAHDWAISAEFVRRSPRPVFLAGGLHAGNAVDAIRKARPFGLDLCSGVRTDGALDPAKLAAFVAVVRTAA